LTRGAWGALVLWLALLAGCGAWLVRHLSVSTDLSAFLPRSATPAQRLLLGQLRDGAAARLVLIGLEGGPGAELAQASQALAQRLEASGLFTYVANGDSGMLARERDFLFEHRYLLSPAVSPQRFSVAGLEAALEESYALLGSPAGALVRATLPSDPTGEMRQVLAELAPASGPRLEHGVWFSPDGRRALLVAQTRAPAFDALAQGRAVNAIRAAYAATPHGTGRMLLTGAGVFTARIHDTVEAEVWRLSALGAALVLGILLAVYRSAVMLAASFVPVASGILAGITAVALGFGKVHGITLGFGVTLIGEAIDYPTYLFLQARAGEPLAEASRRIGPTLNLAVLTTVFGAFAMVFSGFAGLAQLGLLTVVGVAVAGVTTRAVLPALLPRRSGAPLAGALAALLERAAGGARGLRWPAVALVVAALGVVAWNHDRLWNEDLSSLTPVPESAQRLDESLRAAIGAPSLRYLVVARDASLERALQSSEAAAEWLREAARNGWLAGFDVASTYLPSRRTQEARQAALPPRGVLEQRLAAAVAGSPFRAGSFAPFVDAVEHARAAPLLGYGDFAGTALAVKIRSLLFRNADGWNALALLRGVEAPSELARAASHHGQDFVDLEAQSDDLVDTYRDRALRFVGLGLAAILVLLRVALGTVARAAQVVAPVLAAVVLDVAALLWLGQKLSLFNLVALLLVVGVGLNYALFFARGHADEDERARTRRSLLVCAATTLSAFGCLATSSIPVLHEIGVTVGLGAAFSLLLAAVFARGPAARTRPV
jgi:predicted exporter